MSCLISFVTDPDRALIDDEERAKEERRIINIIGFVICLELRI